MSFQSDADNPLQLFIQLEIFPEYADEATLAIVSAVSRDTLDELQNTGYHVQSSPTGQHGGDVLVTIVTTLTAIAANAWANKEIFEMMPRYAYLPFGVGSHICLGRHVALLEGHLILATLAQRVRFEFVGSRPIEPEPLLTLRPKGEVLLRVRWR